MVTCTLDSSVAVKIASTPAVSVTPKVTSTESRARAPEVLAGQALRFDGRRYPLGRHADLPRQRLGGQLDRGITLGQHRLCRVTAELPESGGLIKAWSRIRVGFPRGGE